MRKSGFIASEIIFIFSYAFFLFANAVNGIAYGQATFRDNQRKDTVHNLTLLVESNFVQKASYPEKLIVAEDGKAISIDETNKLSLDAAMVVLKTETNSSSEGTVYCYRVENNEYVVGAKLENETKYERSSSDLNCNFETDLLR